MVRVLIPTYGGDVHATAVAVALERKGHQAVLWHATDFPSRQVASIRITQSGHGWEVRGTDLHEVEGTFDVVWFRRPTYPVLPEALEPGDRKAAQRACDAFYRAIWQLVAPNAFWVNPIGTGGRSDCKPIQLIEAARLGLKIPPTLCGNDPDEIRRFLREHAGHTVYKAFVPVQWKTETGTAHLYTSAVDLDDLPDDDLLQMSAGIFQRRIPKAYEVRVTYIGDQAFPAKLYSQENELAKADWRRAGRTLRVEAMVLPADVDQSCRALMNSLGLLFGCFDFIVTPEGEHYFLEVNSMGQFLWVEEGDASMLLLDAFCELLIQGRGDFEWDPTQAVRFADVIAEARERSQRDALAHIPRPGIMVPDDHRTPEGRVEARGAHTELPSSSNHSTAGTR